MKAGTVVAIPRRNRLARIAMRRRWRNYDPGISEASYRSLSVVIPAHNEAESIGTTVEDIVVALARESIDYEILVVDDASTDSTAEVVKDVCLANPRVRYHLSHNPPGFGFTVRAGLEIFEKDAVAVVMADGSDDPEDLVRYNELLRSGYDCAFGSRFIKGSAVHDYPRFKLVLNRAANWLIRVLFRSGYNDTTNAFKAY